MLPKLQVTLEQGSRDPVRRPGWSHACAASACAPSAWPPPPPAPRAPAALTARPAAEQADAPLLAALRALQLTLVAVGGGVRAAHRRHHARARALPAHAGGSARALCAGLAHGAEATQHPSARWGATGTEGQGPRSATRAPSFTKLPGTCAGWRSGTRVCPPCTYARSLVGAPTGFAPPPTLPIAAWPFLMVEPSLIRPQSREYLTITSVEPPRRAGDKRPSANYVTGHRSPLPSSALAAPPHCPLPPSPWTSSSAFPGGPDITQAGVGGRGPEVRAPAPPGSGWEPSALPQAPHRVTSSFPADRLSLGAVLTAMAVHPHLPHAARLRPCLSLL